MLSSTSRLTGVRNNASDVLCAGSRKALAAPWLALFLGPLACGGTPSPPNDATSREAPADPPAASAKPQPSEHAHRSVTDIAKRSESSSDDRVTNAEIESRLRETMADLPPNSSAQRIALGDIAYPANQEEAQKLAGFTLLVVVAITHDPTELPPSVFHRGARGDFELPLLASRVGGVEPPDLRAVFGTHRFDGLFGIPMQATQMEGAVMANFQMKSRDFKLLTFPSALPPGVEAMAPGRPDLSAIQALVKREFPMVDERSLGPPTAPSRL
jgi:hypothetical protein